MIHYATIVPLSDSVRTALSAVRVDLPPGSTVHSARLLEALSRADAVHDWSHLWLACGFPSPDALLREHDPDSSATADRVSWEGIPLSSTVAASLAVLDEICRTYPAEFVVPGLLALALVADPRSAASTALLANADVAHGELVRLVQVELLGRELAGVEEVFARFTGSVGHQPLAVAPDRDPASAAAVPVELQQRISRKRRQIERLEAAVRQALIVADGARAERNSVKAARYEEAAQVNATFLVRSEEQVDALMSTIEGHDVIAESDDTLDDGLSRDSDTRPAARAESHPPTSGFAAPRDAPPGTIFDGVLDGLQRMADVLGGPAPAKDRPVASRNVDRNTLQRLTALFAETLGIAGKAALRRPAAAASLLGNRWRETEQELERIRSEKDEAIDAGDFDLASRRRREESALLNRWDSFRGLAQQIGDLGRVSPSATTESFAAFISYSRYDRVVARELRDRLERFVRPWLDRRSLRIFLDESSLAANSALRAAIEDALSRSEFLVMLASPAAAESEWVSREIEDWRREKPLGNLLIALVSGAIRWDPAANDFDRRTTTAIPPALYGAYGDEPLWVDLTELDEREPDTVVPGRAASRIADLAARLHHRAKDELIGEHVEHLWASTSRRLADEAGDVAVGDPRLGLLLCVAAFWAGDTPEARRQLFQQFTANPHLLAFVDATSHSIAFSPDGNHLLLADAATSLVELTTLSRRTLLPGGGWSPSFSSDGRLLAMGDGEDVVVWNVEDQEASCRLTLPERTNGIASIAFRPGHSQLACSSHDGRTRIWNVETGNVDHVLPFAGQMSFSPDGRLLASGASSGLRLWSVADGAELTTIAAHSNLQLCSTFSPDGRLLAFADMDEVRLWNLVTGQEELRTLRRAPTTSAGAVTSLAFDVTGRSIVGTCGGELLLWNLDGDDVSTPLASNLGHTEKLAINPRDSVLATLSSDRRPALWSLRRNELGTAVIEMDTDVTSVAADPTGRVIAIGGRDTTLLIGRDPDGILGVIDEPADRVVFLPDGGLVIANGTALTRWQPVSRTRTGVISHGKSGVRGLTVSRDGRRLAFCGNDNRVTIVEIESWEPVGDLVARSAPIYSVAWSPDGATIVSAEVHGVAVWEWFTGARTGSAPTTRAVSTVALSPDGRWLCTAGYSETGLVDLGAGTAPVLLAGDGATVICVSFSPDGRTLAAGTADGLVLWDTVSQLLLARLPSGKGPIRDLAFSADSRTIFTSHSRTVTEWNVDPARLVRRLATMAGRGLTRDEWRRYLPGFPYEEIPREPTVDRPEAR